MGSFCINQISTFFPNYMRSRELLIRFLCCWSWIKAHIAEMVPWRGILLKFICSYKNRAICQVTTFCHFFSKLWPDQSRKCYIFCMKDFVSVLFLFTAPTRGHWLQFKTKNKKIKKVVPNIWCNLEKGENFMMTSVQMHTNLKFTEFCNSGDTMKIFRKWSFSPCLTEFQNVISSRTKLQFKRKSDKKSERCCYTLI